MNDHLNQSRLLDALGRIDIDTKLKVVQDDEPLYDSVASDEDYVVVGKQLDEDRQETCNVPSTEGEADKKNEVRQIKCSFCVWKKYRKFSH